MRSCFSSSSSPVVSRSSRSPASASAWRTQPRRASLWTPRSLATCAADGERDPEALADLLTGYQTPAVLRRRGLARLTAWLINRGVRDAGRVAATAVEAAQAQQTALPGEDTAAQIVADLATQILALDDRLGRIDRQIRDAFRTHPQAEIIESLPGMGPILGAEFVVAAGDMTAYADAGHLASAAGLVPVPRDSGRRTGNLHRPERYSRRLRRVFYLSAQTSIIRDGPNRDYYLKKRGEGCKHVQAVIALARGRTSVLWALLRDDRAFTPTPPATQTA